jgi:hypothetical protein
LAPGILFGLGNSEDGIFFVRKSFEGREADLATAFSVALELITQHESLDGRISSVVLSSKSVYQEYYAALLSTE